MVQKQDLKGYIARVEYDNEYPRAGALHPKVAKVSRAKKDREIASDRYLDRKMLSTLSVLAWELE